MMLLCEAPTSSRKPERLMSGDSPLLFVVFPVHTHDSGNGQTLGDPNLRNKCLTLGVQKSVVDTEA